jgi:formylglycine-generating enzyme required for sulfatase activity
MPNLTQRRTTSTAQFYTEVLDGLGDALPLQVILIPGGSFLMGSPNDEPERESRESPQHIVNIPQCFMGRYPITQAQWKAVATTIPKVDRNLEADPSRFTGDNRPVESISWYDAVEFCERLKKQTKRPYRLPSEAEWEYACRARTTTPFHFGKAITTEVANYNGNYIYNDGPKGEYRQETTPVDHFKAANAFGLSDMHGNVWEWCADHWHENYEGAPANGSAWLDDNSNTNLYILRGGAWFSYPGLCRSAYRFRDAPDLVYFNFGFRVCCSSPRTQ